MDDFNGDHNLDLAVAEFEGRTIGVLLGNGDGTFQRQVRYTANTPESVVAADLDGDGKIDLVSASFTLPTGVTVLMGKGDGTFRHETLYSVGNDNRSVAVGDFNGDKMPDIVFTASGTSYVGVLLNAGSVTFAPNIPLNFKKQAIGTTIAPQTVTLTNHGSTALKISSMKASGAFGITTTCGKSVAPQGTCSINVTFSPQKPGVQSGTVSIDDTASTQPQVIALSGTGT